MQQPWQTPSTISHSLLLMNSYFHWTKTHLLDKDDNLEELARALYESPRVILSHGTGRTQSLITQTLRRNGYGISLGKNF
jgi:hypothetical protein